MESKLIENYLEDIKYCNENEIGKFIIFVKGEQTLIKINEYIKEKGYKIEVIGITFPANEITFEENEEGEIVEYIPESSKGDKIKELLNEQGIILIRSALPFEGIVIPGENFNPYKIVSNTLNLVYDGLANIIQSTMIATDNGVLKTGESAVVSNANIFVDIRGVNSRMLFHPKLGLDIEFIYKK